MLSHSKTFHGNAVVVIHATQKIARKPNLRRPCFPTLEHKPQYRKEQNRSSGSLTNYSRPLSKTPLLLSIHCSLRSKIGFFSEFKPHRIGQAYRSHASDACPEPITGEPNSSAEFAGISRASSLAQEGCFKPVPPLRNSIADRNSHPSPKFWSHNSHKSPDGKDITVHYCKSLKSTEEVARYFLEDQVLGFDMEWKAQASASDTIQNNVSLIQLANKSRIALFQVALFKPARNVNDLVAPSLRKILESPDITKVGVSIKADCTRLRKFLDINARAIFELSHLHKLVKYCHSNPRLINKRLVSLNDQVEEHFGLPLVKEDTVRCSDWTVALNYPQVQYAATDPYACICLFDALNAKRQLLDPMPPLPAHAELDLPIRVAYEPSKNIDSDDPEAVDQRIDSPSKEDL
ncbi:ribonuclease H-like protein [Aspergillus steynii IBT 23096]|uniref:Ribonuclease H-like protein n=1 Tax=Aspergillus steynii IBT 23096 TaxID=1392250 RepID=A0A2I2GMZ0_9EURO|nr:ribonuclease H-like protein [Aspergillus steynii IBT 23096]PLB54244.1 ribonuclease H-like protein [Aspergillus steynii IBT 23096]